MTVCADENVKRERIATAIENDIIVSGDAIACCARGSEPAVPRCKWSQFGLFHEGSEGSTRVR
jgi:hypothetical protein